MFGVNLNVATPVSLCYPYVSSDSMSNTVQFRATQVLIDISFGLLRVFLTNIPHFKESGKSIKDSAGIY